MSESANENGKAVLPIGTLASLTGVNAITLRAWERRYGLLRPTRTAKGHRLYTHDHVESIRRILTLLERGVPVSRVQELLEPEAEDAPKETRPWTGYLERMMAAIARFDEREVDRTYEEATSVFAIENVTRRLLLPLLIRLGERWGKVDGAVAEEHFFAAYLRSKLGARLQHHMRYASGPCVVSACAPGEQHEIGLLLFAIEAQQAGLRTILLGADTPLSDVAFAQRQTSSDGIVISSSIDPAEDFFARALPWLVREVGVPVFIGGGTALHHRKAIAASGAIALGIEIEDGVSLIKTKLADKGNR